MAVMTGQMKRNIQTSKSDTCLLTPNISKFQKVESTDGPASSGPNAVASLEGCYLYREQNDDENRWIRSGKSCGVKCNFGDRHKQHHKGSLLQDEKPSKFYLSYPCASTKYLDSIRRGWFQDVHQYVGMGFNRQDQQAVQVICDEHQGLFEWQPHIYTSLDKCTWHHQDMRNKQLNMVAYLLELFYDLCLSPLDNVSESPGFELPMGIHSCAPACT